MSSSATSVQVQMPQMGISVSEGTILEWRKAVGDEVAADEIDGAPVVITGFRPGHDDHDECARILATLVTTLDLAIDDGVNVEVAFVEPAIAGHDSKHGLLDSARAVTATADVYLA